MEILHTGGGGMGKKFSKFFEKDGFYIILFICVCIVAIAAVIASKGNLKNISDKSQKGEDLIILKEDEEEEDSIEIAKIEDVKDVEEIVDETAENEEADEVAALDDEMTIVDDEYEYTPVNTLEESNERVEMIAPVIGSIGTDYTDDNLIYSETLDEWTAHKGVDIMASEGTQVMAALSGTVQEVYEDPLWGIVVILSHGDNLLTKYAGLSEDGLIAEGVTVNKGDVIGRIGKPAPVEMMMDAHLHFEIIEDGISINPNIYLPSFMYSN